MTGIFSNIKWVVIVAFLGACNDLESPPVPMDTKKPNQTLPLSSNTDTKPSPHSVKPDTTKPNSSPGPLEQPSITTPTDNNKTPFPEFEEFFNDEEIQLLSTPKDQLALKADIIKKDFQTKSGHDQSLGLFKLLKIRIVQKDDKADTIVKELLKGDLSFVTKLVKQMNEKSNKISEQLTNNF